MPDEIVQLTARYGNFVLGNNVSLQNEDSTYGIAGVVSSIRDWSHNLTQLPRGVYSSDITGLVKSQPNYPISLFDRMHAVHMNNEGATNTVMVARLSPSMMVDETKDALSDFFFKLFRGEDFYYVAVAGSNEKIAQLEYLRAVKRLDVDANYPVAPKPHFTSGLEPFQPTVNLVHDYLTM